MRVLPTKGYFSRMRIYLREMCPVLRGLVSSVLLYVSFASFLARLHGVPMRVFSSQTFAGCWSVFSLVIILRLMDELKDKEIDQQLFKERPLPSGRVLEHDIRFSLVVMTALYIFANAWCGSTLMMPLVVLGYSFLMFRYFFIPDILRSHLLLNVATHNPIIPLMLLSIVVSFAAEHGLRLARVDRVNSLLLVLMYWAMFFAWEISRKIRSGEEENAYVTYSRMFGYAGAVLIAAGAQTVAFCIGVYFYYLSRLSEVYLVLLAGAYVFVILGHIRFLVRPSPATSRLKPFAERYILGVIAAQAIQTGLFF